MGSNLCTCATRDHHYNIFKQFWNGVEIKNKTAFVFNESIINSFNKEILIKIKQSILLQVENSNKITNIKNKLFEEFLINKSYPDVSNKLFEKAFDKYENDFEELLICFIFLTVNDKASAKISFKKMCRYYKPDSLFTCDSSSSISSDTSSVITTICINSNERKLFIRKSELFDILKIYVNLVTLFSVKFLVTLSNDNDKKDFVSSMSEEFSEENQNEFLNKKLDKYDKELISIDDFFDVEYNSISDDTLVRNAVSYCNFNQMSNNEIKTTSKIIK